MSSARPKIGVTATREVNDDGTPYKFVVPYLDAVTRAGGAPVVLPNDVSTVDAVLASCAGFIFSGGPDIGVEHYGGNPAHSKPPNPARDAFELALIRGARERAVPTLCVCRGLQLANVAFGGTLIEDLGTEPQSDPPLDHQQVENGLERFDYAPGHVVRIEPDSALAELLALEDTEIETNSVHHQAVRQLSPDLRVSGRTPDGVIESLDAVFAHPFFFAVQWHPEALPPYDPISASLFSGLVAAAARRAK